MTGALTDRLCGLFFVLFGLMLFFHLIPTQIETVEYGAIRPKTLPQILSVAIGVFGAMLLLRPGDGTDVQRVPWLRAAVIVAVLGGGLWLTARFGFLYVAAPLAAVLMLVMGERRPLWLGLGVIVMPGLIWVAVTVLLGRPLP